MCVSPRKHQPQTLPFHCCMPVEDPSPPPHPPKKTSSRRNKKPRTEKIYGVVQRQGRADFFIIVFKLNFSLVQIPPHPGLMAFAGKRGAGIKSPFLGPPPASGPACAGTGSPPGAGILLAALYLEHSSCEPVSPTPPAAWFSVL